jgi:hypothetical protein
MAVRRGPAKTFDPARPAGPPRACRSCGRPLGGPGDIGWECDCGVLVCAEAECFEEYFKTVAGGEGTRCRTCGLVT